MDSSIMSLGAKMKVTMAISQELMMKINPTPLHKVISLRNAFAHHDIDSHPVYTIGKTEDQDRIYHTLRIISHSGRMNSIRRDTALKEFNDNYELAKKTLIELIKKTKRISKQNNE